VLTSADRSKIVLLFSTDIHRHMDNTVV